MNKLEEHLPFVNEQVALQEKLAVKYGDSAFIDRMAGLDSD